MTNRTARECEWTFDGDTFSYDAACGGKWCSAEGADPHEEGHNFCGTCGKPIKFLKASTEEQQE